MSKEKDNAWCAICGKPYHLCLPCNHTKELSPWKIYTDTSEHYKIYQILHGVSTEVYTKEEAKEKFKNVDLSDLDNLRDDIKVKIKDILGITDDTAEVKSSKRSKSSKVVETK